MRFPTKNGVNSFTEKNKRGVGLVKGILFPMFLHLFPSRKHDLWSETEIFFIEYSKYEWAIKIPMSVQNTNWRSKYQMTPSYRVHNTKGEKFAFRPDQNTKGGFKIPTGVSKYQLRYQNTKWNTKKKNLWYYDHWYFDLWYFDTDPNTHCV